MKTIRTLIIGLLIPSILLMSCSASEHFGKTLVTKPPLSETNEGIWYNYWQDQFDAFAGRVVAPSAGKYNDAAVNGYQRAMLDWEAKVSSARLNSYLLYAGIGLGVTLITVLLLTSSGPSYPYYGY